MSPRFPHRRAALRAAAATALLGPAVQARSEEVPTRKGSLRQSICRWCYGKMPLAKLCQVAKKIGYASIELIGPEEVKVVKAAGLTCALLRGGSIADGFNRKENHDKLVRELEQNIAFAAAEGLPAVICLSGNRKGMADDEGLKNCVVGLKRILGQAERQRVTVIMEGLNSRVDHKDYMYDRTAWGVELCKRLGTESFKLLYDIYHMQIMEGDIIRTIQTCKDYIGHYHTGGNPGRNEIDATQELNYPAIMRAIAATGYRGYIGQEFLPRRDPVASLAEAFRICDV